MWAGLVGSEGFLKEMTEGLCCCTSSIFHIYMCSALLLLLLRQNKEINISRCVGVNILPLGWKGYFTMASRPILADTCSASRRVAKLQHKSGCRGSSRTLCTDARRHATSFVCSRRSTKREDIVLL